jgi:hypothetical protein
LENLAHRKGREKIRQKSKKFKQRIRGLRPEMKAFVLLFASQGQLWLVFRFIGVIHLYNLIPFPMKQFLILPLFLMAFSSALKGQIPRPNAFSVALFSEATALPFTRLTPLHPGGEIGLHWQRQKESRFPQQIGVYAGGFHHASLASSLYLRADYRWSYQWKQILRAELAPGLGYSHGFYPGELYELNETGEYEVVSQKGRPRLLAELGIGSSFFPDAKVSPFVKYRFALQTPFANGIPVFPSSFLQIGATINL